MNQRKFSNWLHAYVHYTKHSEAPTTMHLWTGIWTIAGALRRRVWIDQGYFQWTPNVYIILVAPPGIVSKSTTLSHGAKLLRQVEGIKFGPDAVTWQSLVQALAGACEEVLMPDDMFHAMSCVSIASSEFGTLFNPNDREMVDVFVSLWDGQVGVWEKQTKTQGSDRIVNPWINMAACTTPGWIAGNFPEYLVGGGFTSRCLFVYAEEKQNLVAYPGEKVDPEFKQIQENLVHDLTQIAAIAGPYTLDDEAKEFGVTWYEEHYANRIKHLDNPRFGGYLARKQTHIHKIAMVLAAAESDVRIIRKAHLEGALQLVTGLEENMPKVFDLIGVSGPAKYSNEVLSYLKVYKKIERHVLFKMCFRTMGLQEFENALNACCQANQAVVDNTGGKLFVHYTGE
jgi:hypothetical protein